jgi:hypothetical protein
MNLETADERRFGPKDQRDARDLARTLWVTAVDLRIGIAVGVGIAIGIERIDLAMAASFSIPIAIATPTPNAPSR